MSCVVPTGLNPDSQAYRDDADTNFTALIEPERAFGAAKDKDTDVDVEGGGDVVKSGIAKATEDIRLGRQEVCCDGYLV
jgi:hypothetical protein